MATLCLEAYSSSTHSSIAAAVTGANTYNICSAYFFASGGSDLQALTESRWEITENESCTAENVDFGPEYSLADEGRVIEHVKFGGRQRSHHIHEVPRHHHNLRHL